MKFAKNWIAGPKKTDCGPEKRNGFLIDFDMMFAFCFQFQTMQWPKGTRLEYLLGFEDNLTIIQLDNYMVKKFIRKVEVRTMTT